MQSVHLGMCKGRCNLFTFDRCKGRCNLFAIGRCKSRRNIFTFSKFVVYSTIYAKYYICSKNIYHMNIITYAFIISTTEHIGYSYI